MALKIGTGLEGCTKWSQVPNKVFVFLFLIHQRNTVVIFKKKSFWGSLMISKYEFIFSAFLCFEVINWNDNFRIKEK